MTHMPLCHGKAAIDCTHKAKVLLQLKQSDTGAMLIGPSAQKRADPWIGRCIIDQDHVPRDIRMCRHAPQAGNQHVKGIVHRHNDRDGMARARDRPMTQEPRVDRQPLGMRLEPEQMLGPRARHTIAHDGRAQHCGQSTAQIGGKGAP